jgi:dihydroxy-acid dehydratase
MTKTPDNLRSARWFAPDDLRSMGHRSRLMQMGYGHADWVGKPVIAIVNTWSDINQCHTHFKQRVEDVKRGVLQAGGFPLELPAMSLSEPMVKPTTMLYRNFLAMETEELLRSHPVDGAVLMGGCDKTTPGLLMGAFSAGLPCIFLPAGPMLRGNWKGRVLGSGSDTWKYWDERRAGRIDDAQWAEVEAGIARSHGTCMTMGTAATMMGIAEALGLTLPGASSIPAPDANHPRMAAECGRRIVQMVWDELSPQSLLTRAHFLNAINVAMAMGCSTNAIIHLVALSRRAGAHCTVTLDDFDAASRKVPVLANIRPSGDTYLMEDFYYAGGMPGLLSRLRGHLDLHARTVNGRTLGQNIDGAEVHDDDVIRPLDKPIYAEGALAVLRGNLAPGGCVIKPSACAPHLLQHSGPALVFDDYPALKKAIDDPDLDVTADHVLVLRYAGPLGGPGMPEWGMLPIPTKLVKAGVTDMLRLSDARMSGTSYGACMLHCAPEAYVGAPLALVHTGDLISVDVPSRRIHLDVDDAELARRRAAWTPPPRRYERGYGWMFSRHILQADQGCDFDFLETGFGAPVAEPDIF